MIEFPVISFTFSSSFSPKDFATRLLLETFIVCMRAENIYYVKFDFYLKICYNKVNSLYFTQQSTEKIINFFWRCCVKPPENFRRKKTCLTKVT